MNRVAVLGGGPAGATAAAQLASAGVKTVLLDEKLAWEKPCGGGVTFKAYREYAFLRDNGTPKTTVSEMRLAAPGTSEAKLELQQPLLIYSRMELNRLLLERAARAGSQVERCRVLRVTREGRGWRVHTRQGSLEADFCIIATGARNALRDEAQQAWGAEFAADDTMYALGYYIPERQEHIDIQFLADLEGYIWVFPRCGHLSAGICGKGEAARELRARLERYLDGRGISYKNGTFYGHVLPSLGAAKWGLNRVAGEGWMAVGDAAGLVDPITGEGIYYAIRSGDLAAQVALDETIAPQEKPAAYRARLRRDFADDLAFGARLATRVYLGRFLFDRVPTRAVQFSRRSRRFGRIVEDLVNGSQPYTGLKRRLWRNLPGALLEMARG